MSSKTRTRSPLVPPFAAVVRPSRAGRSRFALRVPGRELGRFPSTPPSSVMDSDSSSARFGYTGPGRVDDKVLSDQLVDWLVGGNCALGRLTSLSVALVSTTSV